MGKKLFPENNPKFLVFKKILVRPDNIVFLIYTVSCIIIIYMCFVHHPLFYYTY